MIVVPFIPAHLEGFELQKKQAFIHKYMTDPKYVKVMTDYGEAHTGIEGGKPVVIAGMYQPHNHIGCVWALLSKDCNQYLLAATRHIKKWLDSSNISRLETAVHRDFLEGQRWANMLGFTRETNEHGMKNFGVDDGIYDLYARYS